MPSPIRIRTTNLWFINQLLKVYWDFACIVQYIHVLSNIILKTYFCFQPFKNRTTFMKTVYKTRNAMNIDFVCARSLRSCCSTEMLLSHNTDFSRHYRVNESRWEFFGGNYVATTLNAGYKRYKKIVWTYFYFKWWK